MPVPLLDLSAQHETLMPELRDAFNRVVGSGDFILGPFVRDFEQAFADACDARHAVGVSSGTDALLVAMMALGIGPGDEVITTPFTFFSTAGSIARLGAKPVFVDINPRSFNLEPNGLHGAITRATKAIMPVHLFGLAARMDEVMQIASDHGLYVIEDAAQASGAKIDGRHVGTFGHVGCFSFYPTKNLPAMGDAGACITNDDELAERMRTLRNHGASRPEHFERIGGNFRLDAMQAAMLSVKLPHVEDWVQRRRAHAERYSRRLEDMPVGTPFESAERFHAYNQYTIRVHGGAREALRHHLNGCGIGNRVYYPRPLHLQPCFAYLKYGKGRFPVAEAAAAEVLSLPVYPELAKEQQDEVIQTIRDFFTAE